MKLAQIEKATVVNIAVFDPENIPAWAADWVPADSARIGDYWDGERFTTPETKPDEPAEGGAP